MVHPLTMVAGLEPNFSTVSNLLSRRWYFSNWKDGSNNNNNNLILIIYLAPVQCRSHGASHHVHHWYFTNWNDGNNNINNMILIIYLAQVQCRSNGASHHVGALFIWERLLSKQRCKKDSLSLTVISATQLIAPIKKQTNLNIVKNAFKLYQNLKTFCFWVWNTFCNII